MNLQIPIGSIHKVSGGGLSVFGSIPSTRFLKSLAAEWSSFRGSLGEAGRRGTVGSVPQVLDDGAMISIQAFVEDSEAIGKLQVGALRTFKLAVDENSGRLGEILLYDGGGEGHGLKLYKRNTNMSQIRPEFAKFMRQMGLTRWYALS